jgi:hypothetical protein
MSNLKEIHSKSDVYSQRYVKEKENLPLLPDSIAIFIASILAVENPIIMVTTPVNRFVCNEDLTAL